MRTTTTPNLAPLRCALVLLVLCGLSSALVPAHGSGPMLYTVGSGSSCTFQDLRSALASAALQTNAFVEIHLAETEDDSLGYSWSGMNSEVHLTDVDADIDLIGGFASCDDGVPAPHQTTRLEYANASADAGHSLLSVSNAVGNARFYLQLRNLILLGADDSSAGGPGYGGGLKLSNNVDVTLDNSTLGGFHADNGGGIALLGSSGDPSTSPRLRLTADSGVNNNTAGAAGGGIFALLGRVVLDGATIYGNKAAQDGGGIWVADLANAADGGSDDSHFALVLDSGSGENRISANRAARDGSPWSATQGLGGAVYSLNGQIRFKAAATAAGFHNLLTGNVANVGGAIYVLGPNQPAGGPYTHVEIYNTAFVSNQSIGAGGALYTRNAVTTTIAGQGGPCDSAQASPPDGFGPGPCSLFYGNYASGSGDGAGAIARGGAIFIDDQGSAGASRGIVRVYRTWFHGNGDPNGLAAVAATGGASEMVFSRDIFTANHAGSGNSALLVSTNGKNVDFRYNTVLDSNSSVRMFYMDGGKLYVTGSILWGTVDRTHPFHFVWFKVGSASIIHGDCLLVRDSDSGTADLPDPGMLWSGHAPQLGNDFAPGGSSAAIDHCDAVDGYVPPDDAYGRGVYDVPGVPPRFVATAPLNFDLGAVEQTDIIYANSFGNRPDN